MSHIPDYIIRDIIRDQIDCRLIIARHFLDKITPSIPKENSFEHFLLETNIDAFLFFSSSVIDMIKVEINNRFNLFDKENVFYIHGIRKKLGNSEIQRQVKDVIAKYFSIPVHHEQSHSNTESRRTIKTDQGYFDAASSTLLELQTLRNKAVHGKVLNITEHGIDLEFTIRHSGMRKNPKYLVTIENPNEYFLQIFNNLSSFVEQIRLLSPQKAQSTHHIERLEFKLE